MQILITLSLALLAGLMLSRVAKILGLPAVTAYLVAGIVIGPFLLGAIEIPEIGFLGFNAETHSELDIDISNYALISDVALGFIAFSIGNEFRISQLKKIGRQATVIGIWQAVATTLVVDGALIGLHFILGEEVLPLSAAIVLGAIASATAPAATLMVVKQYKAKGPLTDILLPVVALDDAVGLVLFAVSFGISRSLSAGAVEIVDIVFGPILEVAFSLLLGFAMGMIFTYAEKFFHSNSKRLAMSICFVLLTVALSKIEFSMFGIHVAFSPLLSCMMLGTVFCNACDFSEELMGRADRWATPILILFFVLSGAELDLLVFTKWQIVLIGVIYIIFRSAGKIVGAFSSAKLMRCEDNIVKYLGITLLPQAGVALGMAIKAREALPSDIGALIASITLFAVLVYELVGPMLTKMALTSAGDIIPEGKTSARRRDGIHFRRPHDVHHSETHK
ncbi:MAG: cation:proton antiporter [Clostridia bacterium]|nr:cation:proton antiporter [Clostridia bacterium]